MSSFIEAKPEKIFALPSFRVKSVTPYALCITYTLTVALIFVPKCTQLIEKDIGGL